MNIILCGMMGCGKTTVGVCLAKKMNREYVDTDAVIVERFGSIADIFERYGEGYFRDLETEVVKELGCENDLVIATGGGLVLRQENVKLLKANGKIVFLQASVDTLVERLQTDTERPLLHKVESLRARVQELLKDRARVYENVADFIVDVDEKNPEQIAREIVERIGQV